MDILIFIEKYFILFMVYAIGGWCIEEINCSIIEKKVVDRGFLIGPVCPIYGFGGLAMTIFLTKFINSPITVFCMGVIICAVLEYFTSYIMEKVFNARWWDYSHEKLNLNGRICLKTLIPFGFFGILLIYFLNPFIFKMIDKMNITVFHILSLSIALVMLLDIIVSLSVIWQVTDRAKKITEEHPKDNTNEITARVKDELKQSMAGSRLVDAFPNFSTKIKEIAEKTAKRSKEAMSKGKEKAKQHKQAVVKKIKKQ